MTDGGGRRPIDLGGGVRVTPFVTAHWRADAAPLFGPVPKVLWSKVVGDAVDGEERIGASAIALLVETPEARFLIDPGPGEEPGMDAPAMAEFTASPVALDARAMGGLDLIVLTNLRAEHAGALLDADGAAARSPGVAVAAQAREWDAAVRVNDRVASMVDQRGVRMLVGSGPVRALDGRTRLAPGVEVLPTGGFTVGHQVVLVHGRGEGAGSFAWFGDLLPTRWHANPRWITAFDDLPLESVAAKTELFRRAAEEGWLVLPSHDPVLRVARLVADRDRFRLEDADGFRG